MGHDAHRGAARGGHPALLSTTLQSLFEFPPALRTTRATDRRQRQTEARVPPYQTPWETFQKLPQAADHLKPGQTIEALDRIAQVESDTAAARRMQRAASQEQAVCEFRVREPAAPRDGRRAMEMTGDGKRGKPKAGGFPRFPTPLEIAPRFPHSHSPDDDSLPFLTHPRKEPSDSPWMARTTAASSGSSFDEKMLFPPRRS